MQINFSKTFLEQFSQKLDIRPKHAEDAIQHKDQVEVMVVGDLRIAMFLKRVILPNREFTLLVGGRQVADNLTVEFAFKVLPSLYSGESATPLSVLRKLADRFGLDLTIGSVTSKFVIKQQIICNNLDPTTLVSLRTQGKPSFVQVLYLKPVAASPPYVDCALCFCINTDEYGKWIQQKQEN